MKLFISDFEDVLDVLSDEQFGALFRALQRYIMYGESAKLPDDLKLTWITLKAHVNRINDYSQRQAEYGKAGGRPKGYQRVDKGTEGFKASESEFRIPITESKNKDNKNKDTVRAKEDFNQFWESWPKKVGKADAIKAWNRHQKQIPTITRLVGVIEMNKHSDQWKRGIIPNPATWINGQRWDDDTHIDIPTTPQFIPKLYGVEA